MRVSEFKRINLKILQDGNIIYEGVAENAPEEIQRLITKEIKIQPNLAVITVDSEKENKIVDND